MQTRIYRKKYVIGSLRSEEHLKQNKKTRCDAYSGPDVFIYVIKSPIQLVRQSFKWLVYYSYSHFSLKLSWIPFTWTGLLSPEIKAILDKQQIALEKQKVQVHLHIQPSEVGTTKFCSDYLSSSSFTRVQKNLDKQQIALEKQKVQVHLHI